MKKLQYNYLLSIIRQFVSQDIRQILSHVVAQSETCTTVAITQCLTALAARMPLSGVGQYSSSFLSYFPKSTAKLQKNIEIRKNNFIFANKR
jgi:hypothetical protein